ncbi:MAG: hypothetical protein LUC87_01680 [Clostridiales bacterium]|nr:hypothetical protein [Clostridiales bacterium]
MLMINGLSGEERISATAHSYPIICADNWISEYGGMWRMKQHKVIIYTEK